MRRRRRLASAVGVLLAGLMAGAALTVAFGLTTGFERSARAAALPDVIVRFAPERREEVARVLDALPNLDRYDLRFEARRQAMRAGPNSTRRGAVQIVGREADGYAIVEGRDVRPRAWSEIVVERGLARAWDLAPGDPLRIRRAGTFRVVGVAVAPDNVAFPLTPAPRVWVSGDGLEDELPANQALLWAVDPTRVDVLLQQARATSFGIEDVRFVTRAGVRVAIDRAAGVVVALLAAFSLVALGAAGTMLAATAAADVQRRLPALGVLRALGVSRARVAGRAAAEAALVGLAAGGAGLALGALLARGPSADLLAQLNGLPPGTDLLAPLAGALVAIVALSAAAAAWPAWRAAGRSPVALLRGAELAGRPPRRGLPAPRALAPALLGARLALARRGRAAATVAVLAVSGAVVVLLLGLASLLLALRDDPGALGKRYQLTAALPPQSAPQVAALPGVAAVAPRYEVQGADSFSLGEPVKLVALARRDAGFERPPLADGRRARDGAEAEVGIGLAQALGVRPGGTLAVQLPSGAEVRFRVVGTVRALDDEGRVAYVRPGPLLAADPVLVPQLAVRLERGADAAAVSRRLAALGAPPARAGGATSSSASLLAALAALLRAVAAIDVLVCLYALVQSLALTARDRRPTLALLRATGAGAPAVTAVLAGAALAVALPAAALAVVLERLALAPLVGALAAGYADLGSGASAGQAAIVFAGIAALALLAAGWVARRILAEPPVRGLGEAT